MKTGMLAVNFMTQVKKKKIFLTTKDVHICLKNCVMFQLFYTLGKISDLHQFCKELSLMGNFSALI